MTSSRTFGVGGRAPSSARASSAGGAPVGQRGPHKLARVLDRSILQCDGGRVRSERSEACVSPAECVRLGRKVVSTFLMSDFKTVIPILSVTSPHVHVVIHLTLTHRDVVDRRTGSRSLEFSPSETTPPPS